MSKVFCGDCDYCKACSPGNTAAKCQHPNNIVDETWHSVAAKDTCAILNRNNDCTWFSEKRISNPHHPKYKIYDL